jgi:hypothetical protein
MLHTGIKNEKKKTFDGMYTSFINIHTVGQVFCINETLQKSCDLNDKWKNLQQRDHLYRCV